MSESSHDPNVPQTDAGAEDPIVAPLSDYDALMARLKESPHDPESWKRLIHEAEMSGDILRIREAYDALLAQYPNTASAQTAYTAHFLNSPSSYGEAEELLNKFLRTSPSAELWKFYLDYVRRANSGPKMHEILRKAYDFALNHIGQDRDSGSIWADYIQFLNAADTTTTWQAQQKMDVLRKVYQRAVQIPLDNVEQLWTQYEAFEAGLNKITAKKFMSDLSPSHMQARTVLRQLSIHFNGLGSSAQAGIFLPSPATFSEQERQLIGRWKVYLEWEEGNPLEIEDKDRNVLTGRIEKAYRRAVIRMRYYPEIWFMAYSWTTSVGKNEEAISILKSGLIPNPDSFALTYAYVELLEKAELKKDQRDFTEINNVYERFFGVHRANLARLAAAAHPPPAEDANGEGAADAATADAPVTQDIELLQKELAEYKKMYSNAWINCMRFARRAQGHKAYRDAFGKARREEYIGWEVYEAAAMTEYRCNLEDGGAVAARILKTGMKKFGSDVSYVLAHLSFLLTINDEKSMSLGFLLPQNAALFRDARSLFEHVIKTFTPPEAKPIWECWSRSQYQYDDLEAVLELERRMTEVYPSDPPIKRFAQRHTYHSIDAIANHDLGFVKTHKLGGSATFHTTASVPPPGAPSSTLINPNNHRNGAAPTNPNKRVAPPPDHEDRKRQRPDERDRDRRRYSPPPSASGPSWERDRDVKPPMPPREKEKKPPIPPPVIHRFLTQLPPRETFDGLVSNTENLMETLRNAVIPSTTRARPPSRPPPRQGRPPPDYGPYQGPESMPTRGNRRRY
ncbi:Suf-domain-containing protein [Mycena vitilis]|nr:Suf-domain-containing protein [Mycena vitilis]KAJ6462692.1 Suf-domain-containing protein [Mycena vitilis]